MAGMRGIRNYISKPASANDVGMLMTWLFFMSLAIFLSYRRGFFEGLEHPANTFLPHPETRFGDFFGAFDQWNVFGGFGGVGYGVSYFPATYLPLEILRQVTLEPWTALTISQWFYLITVSFIILWAARNKGIATTAIAGVLVLMSYPSLMILHTGNLEGWIAPLLLASAVCAANGKWNWFGVFVGAAIAFKAVPAVFLLVPFFFVGFRVGIRTALVATSTAIAMSLCAVIVLPNGFLDRGVSGVFTALSAIRESQAMYSELMVDGPAGIHYGHSILNSIHAFAGMEFMPARDWAVVVVFVILALGLLGLILLREAHAPLWTFFAVAAAIGCLAPATSTDYKLIYLAPAIVLLVTTGGETGIHLRAWGLVVVAAMSPKPWLLVGVDPWANATVYGTAILLISIMCLMPILSYLTEKRNENQGIGLESTHH